MHPCVFRGSFLARGTLYTHLTQKPFLFFPEKTHKVHPDLMHGLDIQNNKKYRRKKKEWHNSDDFLLNRLRNLVTQKTFLAKEKSATATLQRLSYSSSSSLSRDHGLDRDGGSTWSHPVAGFPLFGPSMSVRLSPSSEGTTGCS